MIYEVESLKNDYWKIRALGNEALACSICWDDDRPEDIGEGTIERMIGELKTILSDDYEDVNVRIRLDSHLDRWSWALACLVDAYEAITEALDEAMDPSYRKLRMNPAYWVDNLNQVVAVLNVELNMN